MSANLLNNISLFSEVTSIPTSVDILTESAIAPGVSKIKFKAILQERDVKNNNGRIYSDAVLREIVRQLSPKATERKLFCELDHPVTLTTDVGEKLKRSSTVSLERACINITKIEYDGRFIVAECETLTTPNGLLIYSLIKDKAVFGFSLRALGEAHQRPDGTIEVSLKNLNAITFDAVSNPSHGNSVITDILTESTLASAKESATTVNGLIAQLREHKKNVNEVILEGSTYDLLTKNGNPELLEESYFVQGSNGTETLRMEKDLDPIQKGILLESTGVVLGNEQDKLEKFCVGNTCMVGTIEESIQYLMKLDCNQQWVGFKF